MTMPLDHRFAKAITLMRSAARPSDRFYAMMAAAAAAKACGRTMEEALAELEGRPARQPEPQSPPICVPEPQPAGADEPLDARISRMLSDDASLSDRTVSRAVGCSPTTVGKIRRKLDLSTALRSVHRGGRTYTFRPASAAAASERQDADAVA